MSLSSLLPALLLVAMPPAEPDTGAPSKPEDIRMLHRHSRCVVDAAPNQAARVLSLDYRTDFYRRSLGNLVAASSRCAQFNGRLRMARVLVAGAFAEALLPRALAGRSLAAAVAHDPARAPIEARDDGEYLGLCAVRSMSEQVTALLATAAGSEEEKRAVAAITPGLSRCVRTGASAKLNRLALRALVALAAYRIVSQAGSSAAKADEALEAAE
jgi:hypothetical protein